MKKIMLLVSALTLGLTILNAQPIKPGSFDFAVGVGLLPTFVADGAGMKVPPLSFRVGYRLAEKFSLGAYAAYSSSETDQVNLPDGRNNHVVNDSYIVGLRAAAHTIRFDKWDIYGGLMAGYQISEVQQSAYALADDEIKNPTGPIFSRPTKNNFIFSGFVGATYFPGNRVGVFGEAGFGISILNLGVQIKL